MSESNGHQKPSAPFMVTFPPMQLIGTVQRDLILTKLAAFRQSQEANIGSGPIIDEATESFREWSKIAEPGMVWMSNEIKMIAVRASAIIPPAQFVSSSLTRSMGVKDAIEDRINADPMAGL